MPLGRNPYAQEGCVVSCPVVITDTSEGCAYRVRIKFPLCIILTSDTYSDDWAFRQHPLKRLSSSADHDNLPESDTGPFYSALDWLATLREVLPRLYERKIVGAVHSTRSSSVST